MENPFLRSILDRAQNKANELFVEVWKGGERTSLSWASLVARALRYSALLSAKGVVENDVVFIILRHDVELYPSFLGAMLAGAVPSFLPYPTIKQSPEAYWKTHRAVFERTSAACVITYDELRTNIEEACKCLATKVVTPNELNETNDLSAPVIRPSAATALLQHSSGTTGLKKGVALSYDMLLDQLNAYAFALGNPERHMDICSASWLPLYHDMGLITSFMMPMFFGHRLASLDAFEWLAQPAQLFEVIEGAKANLVWLPNFAFNHLVRTVPRNRRFDLSHVLAFINCSEPCKPASFDVFLERFQDDGVTEAQLQACYAMAEATFAVTQTQLQIPVRRYTASLRSMLEEHKAVVALPGEPSASLLSNGQTIPNAKVKINSGTDDLAEGEIGEILVRSTSLFREYFADPGQTASSLSDGWYKTGDLGFIDAGELFVIGRKKDLIIVNGRNFYAHDIEALLANIEGLKPGRAVVFGVYSKARGSEQIVVVAEAKANADLRALPARVTSTVEKTYGIVPGDVRIVQPGWLLKTTSGKIGRSANLEKYLEHFGAGAERIISLQKEQ